MPNEKQSKLEKQFLEKYRDLENALRDEGSLSVADIEV